MNKGLIRRIFVVDDESLIAETLARILHISGFEAVSFTNPLEALNAASLDPPDLLISDVLMPQITGVELAIRTKKLCPSCKVLLFSGQAATTDLLSTARLGGYDFHLLSKPVHPADLLAQIRTHDSWV